MHLDIHSLVFITFLSFELNLFFVSYKDFFTRSKYFVGFLVFVSICNILLRTFGSSEILFVVEALSCDYWIFFKKN
jgi:hypothetical protein